MKPTSVKNFHIAIMGKVNNSYPKIQVQIFSPVVLPELENLLYIDMPDQFSLLVQEKFNIIPIPIQ